MIFAGSFKINVLCDETSAFVCDDWFDIQSTGAAWRQTNAGQCHVTINYCKEIVLPLEEYRSLADVSLFFLIRNGLMEGFTFFTAYSGR